MEPLYSKRMRGFRAEMARRQRSAFLVSQQQNLRYLSGFSGDSSWLVVTQGEQILFTDSRYTQQAMEECAGWRIVTTQSGLIHALKEYCAQAGIRDLGFDYKQVSVEIHTRLSLSLSPGVSLHGEEDPAYVLRQIKDEWELAQMEKAASIAEEALMLVKAKMKAGMTEREISWTLNDQMCRNGSDGTAFQTIVAAGQRGALPHAQPTDYQLNRGDFITIDFGAVVNGYCSDMTRTFILGDPDALQIERYNTVLEAQKIALAGIRPGVSVRAIDRIAREHLEQAGYGDYFGHGLGHSLGLEIHEEPRFSPLAEELLLAPGMVMTVEPGIYIPGWGGLRIEDFVTVTDASMNNLTWFPKTLDEMILF